MSNECFRKNNLSFLDFTRNYEPMIEIFVPCWTCYSLKNAALTPKSTFFSVMLECFLDWTSTKEWGKSCSQTQLCIVSKWDSSLQPLRSWMAFYQLSFSVFFKSCVVLFRSTYLSSAFAHSWSPRARPSWINAVLRTSWRAVYTSIEPAPVWTSSLKYMKIICRVHTGKYE